MAYNEEANIARLLQAALEQKTRIARLREIIVVASGCTDRTADIAQEFATEYPQVKVFIQPERQGKAAAINLFLREATGEVVIVESGDTVPSRGAYEELVQPFLRPEVGMTGAHPVPVNDTRKFMGFCAHFLWGLHHLLAHKSPKLGEMIAFRRVVKEPKGDGACARVLVREIPEDTAVDEASIEALVHQAGLRLEYVPWAIVYNKGPETVADFLKQRRRIANGHLHLKHCRGYAPSTTSLGLIFSVVLQWASQRILRLFRLRQRKGGRYLGPYALRLARYFLWGLGAVALEAYGRLLGWYDFRIRQANPVKWEPALTTKQLSKK